MVFGLLSRVVTVRVTVAYAAIVTAVSAAMLTLSPEVHDRIIRHASTNLHNLSHGRVQTLLGSAFVVDAGPIYVWLPGLVCLMGLGELLWRSRRLIVAFVVGHVGATLLVALGLTAAVEFGWLPGSVTRATDVGMSYGAAGVLGSVTGAIPQRWRPAWVGWWLAVAIAVAAAGQDFTDIGHAVALILGMVVSTRFGAPRSWTPMRLAVLGLAAAFGFLVVASTSLTMATAAGSAGAVAAECWVRLRNRRKPVQHALTQAMAPEGNACEVC